MTIKTQDPFILHKLLSDLHDTLQAQVSALTAIIEYQDDRISRIEQLLRPSKWSN